jgi:ABC-type multidrug transport system ATPase subunit
MGHSGEGDAMIELIGVEKSYRGRAILKGAGLTVDGGESVALVGANGSGKTTTLRCAVGLARPDSGRITIDGIDAWTRQQEARARLSYLAQRTDFPPTLTVREILHVVAALRGAPARSVEREISLCGLARLAGRTVSALSGGERQRVAMAAMFIPDVSTYLLDEPTVSLDPVGTRVLVDRLRALRAQGRAVLFTTHVHGDIEGLATRVAILREGRVVPVAELAGAGERHVSVAVDGRIESWIDAAVHGGALRAWSNGGRLHAIVTDDRLSSVLGHLERQGASVGAFRTETALASALDQLDDEEHDRDLAKSDSINRTDAVGELWRHARWAGANPSGPR